MDNNGNLQEIPKVIIISYRLEDNSVFRPTVESLLKLIFKRGGLKYDMRIYKNDEVSAFYGKLPCLYVNGNIVQHKNIIKFVKSILINEMNREDNEYDRLIEKLEFIISSELDNQLEFLYFLKKEEKINRSNKFFKRLKYMFFKNVSYEETASEFLNIKENNKMENITENILKNYHKLHYLLLKKGKLNDHTNGLFNLIEAYFYSFLKAERTLFNEIDRFTLQNIKLEDKKEIEDFYEYFKSFNTVKKSLKINLKPTEEIIKISSELTMIFSKKKKLNENTMISEIQMNSQTNFNLMTVSLFFLITLFFSVLRKRNSHI